MRERVGHETLASVTVLMDSDRQSCSSADRGIGSRAVVRGRCLQIAIRGRRGAPDPDCWARRLGRIEPGGGSGGLGIYSQGAIESVAVVGC